MPIKMRSTANKPTTQRMNPSWQSRNFAWSGCMLIIIPALPNTQNGSSFWKKCLQSAAQAAGLSRRFTPIGAESTFTWALCLCQLRADLRGWYPYLHRGAHHDRSELCPCNRKLPDPAGTAGESIPVQSAHPHWTQLLAGYWRDRGAECYHWG